MALDDQFKSDVVTLLKDMREYLALAEKGDTEQVKEDNPDNPKLEEKQPELQEAPDLGLSPDGKDVHIQKADSDVEEAIDEAKEKVKDEDEEMPQEEDEELKSLLKDISTILKENTTLKKEMQNLEKSQDAKVDAAVEERLRKLGFQKTRAPITKVGVSQTSETGSGDMIQKQMVQADDLNNTDMDAVVKQMSSKSFAELAQIREKIGDLSAFPTYIPRG